jgi:RimJ/RimL family protein N-acetyltransferase
MPSEPVAVAGPAPNWLTGRRWHAGPFTVDELAERDIEALRVWRNAQTSVLRQKDPITPEQQRRWYDDVVRPTHASASPSFLLVALRRRDDLVAYGGLTNVSWRDRRAEVSFLADTAVVADDAAYREVFLAFLAWLDGCAFGELGLHRLFTETYAYRTFHLSLLEEHGFVPEGRLRHHVVKDGAPVDSLLHGRLETDR